MLKGTIKAKKELEKKTANGNPYYSITVESDGVEMQGETTNGKVNPGQEYEFEQENNFFKFKTQNSYKKSYGGQNNKSFALSYAKDLVIAGKIDLKEIETYAENFNTWLSK